MLSLIQPRAVRKWLAACWHDAAFLQRLQERFADLRMQAEAADYDDDDSDST
jgi:hypothetical protein